MGRNRTKDLLQGALELLVLRLLRSEPLNGWDIMHRLQLVSGDVLSVTAGSLYPALHRLELKRWLQAEWRPSDTGREAKFYKLSRRGKAQLERETAGWDQMARAIYAVLRTVE